MERWRYRRRRPTSQAVNVLGMSLHVPVGVLHPAHFATGPCLARACDAFVGRGTSILDVGTGSGIVALYAARLGARVCAVDIDPLAVRTARVNAMLNDVELDVREGDLFEPFAHRRFDVVTFNPPFFERPQGGALQRALSDGPGLPTLGRFVAALDDMLTDDGVALVVGSTNGAMSTMRRHYAGWSVALARSEERLSERLLVDALTRPLDQAPPDGRGSVR
jgi:release factor glutamine methyltransferase